MGGADLPEVIDAVTVGVDITQVHGHAHRALPRGWACGHAGPVTAVGLPGSRAPAGAGLAQASRRARR